MTINRDKRLGVGMKRDFRGPSPEKHTYWWLVHPYGDKPITHSLKWIAKKHRRNEVRRARHARIEAALLRTA